MYPGNASGSNNAQLNNRFPGNAQTLVSHAQPTPITSVPAPTPSTSSAEFTRYPVSTVSRKCCQTSLAGCSTKLTMVSTGRLKSSETSRIPGRQPRCHTDRLLALIDTMMHPGLFHRSRKRHTWPVRDWKIPDLGDHEQRLTDQTTGLIQSGWKTKY